MEIQQETTILSTSELSFLKANRFFYRSVAWNARLTAAFGETFLIFFALRAIIACVGCRVNDAYQTWENCQADLPPTAAK